MHSFTTLSFKTFNNLKKPGWTVAGWLVAGILCLIKKFNLVSKYYFACAVSKCISMSLWNFDKMTIFFTISTWILKEIKLPKTVDLKIK